MIVDLDQGLLLRSRALVEQLQKRAVRPKVAFQAQTGMRREFLHWCFDNMQVESMSFERLEEMPPFHLCLTTRPAPRFSDGNR